MSAFRHIAAAALAGALALAGAARADDAPQPPPPLKLNLLETLDLWTNVQGGIRRGGTVLSKLRVSATWNAAALGDPDLNAHVQLFAVNGRPFSGDFVGDIQTLSNIEAPTSVRLFDLWAEQSFGDKGSVRVGLIDLNNDFDNIAPAALFISSSHGIGPDISKSGRNGPSIFPVSSFGVRGVWTPGGPLAIKGAVFDGVSGDPNRPGAFVIARLARSDGALLIGQADWKLADSAQASVGVWGYTARSAFIDPARPGGRQQKGLYGFIDGPLPIGSDWTGWVRVGVADPTVDLLDSYVGLGLVKQGPLPGRKADQAGIAVAAAGIARAAQRADGLPDTETAIEATYRLVVSSAFALQPDIQYIVHPATAPRLPNALVLGLRLILTGEWPRGSTDTED